MASLSLDSPEWSSQGILFTTKPQRDLKESNSPKLFQYMIQIKIGLQLSHFNQLLY